MFRTKTVPLALLLFVGGAFQPSHAVLKCGGPTVDTNDVAYNVSPAIRNTSVGAFGEFDIRVYVMVAAVGVYRSENGQAALRAGMTFKMIYRDGSRECGVVTSGGSSITAVPIEDTQRDGRTFEVDDARVYMKQFRPTGMNGISGTYTICYDYYSNGNLTATQCTAHVW